MASRRIKKKRQKTLIKNQIKEISKNSREFQQRASRKRRVSKLTLKELQDLLTSISQSWKNQVNVDQEVGKKNYTKGQRSYVKALKLIEEKTGKTATQIKEVYGSDDIEELANQVYVKDLEGYNQEDLQRIEREFNQTHGYQIRIERATNPFEGIDFFNL